MIRRLPAAVVHAAATALSVFFAAGDGAATRAADDEVIELLPQQAEESRPNLQALDAQFDQNVFGDQPGWGTMVDGGMVAEPDVLATAGRLADGRLATIERICGLEPAQVRALRLAMESDIRRMVEAVGRERAKYEGEMVDLNDPTGQRRFNLLQQDAARSRERVKGLFEAGSLFRKSLVSVLDETQAGRLTGSRDKQRALLWKSLVLAAMLELDELLGLDQSQADAIERLLLEKVPPLRVENPPAEIEQQETQRAIVLAMLAEADQKRLRAAVSSRQWRVLSMRIEQHRRMRRANLEHQGIFERPPTPAR